MFQSTPSRGGGRDSSLDATKSAGVRVIIVHFDGLCLPKNPGGVATYGFVVERDGRKIHEGRGIAGKPYDPATTNNVAEYTGVLRALEYLVERKLTAEPVIVRGDSELVIKQLKGEYKVKSPNIAPLHGKARALFFRFSSLRFEWVPRERNRDADALTNLAYAEYLATRSKS